MDRVIMKEKANKKTAIIITPPESLWPVIQQIRNQHDQKAAAVWMPHIKLLFPFVDEELFKHSLATLQSVLATLPPFTISLDRADYLEHSKKAFTLVLKPAAKASADLIRLQRALETAFPQCDEISARFGTFNPHLTLGQFQDKAAIEAVLKQLNATWKPVEFTVQQIHLVSRRDSGKFVLRHSLSLTGTAASMAAQETFLAPKSKPKQKANLSKCQSAPIYRFENDEWIEFEPSDSEMANFPQATNVSKLRVVTYNVLFDEHESDKIHTKLRVPAVLALLKAQRAHIIGLQEVTTEFMSHLLHEEWVQKHYFLSEQSAGPLILPYGQVILSVFPFRLAVQSFQPSIKRFLFGEFLLQGGAQKLIVPVLHLTSEHGSGNTSETRRRQMSALYETLGDERDALVLGDFNFGEDFQSEIRSEFIDCWRALRPDQPGYTFDPQQNTIAAITSRSGRRMRYDRVLVRSSRWRPVDIRVFGTDSLDMQSRADPSLRSLVLFPSDHFGLVCDLELLSPDRVAYNSAEPLAQLLDSLGAIESDQRLLQKQSLVHHLHEILSHGFPESEISLNFLGSAMLKAGGPSADVDVLCLANVERAMFFDRLPKVLRAASITQFRIITDALVPVAKLKLFDIEIDLQFANPIVRVSKKPGFFLELDALPYAQMTAECIAGINSLKEAHLILRSVPNVQNFRLVLLFVKYWAKQRGLYSNRMGYLGGVSWTLMVARICQLFATDASVSPLKLIAHFFDYYSKFDWSAGFVTVNPEQVQYQREPRDLMSIVIPIRPFKNTARNLTPSTRDLILSELRSAAQITANALISAVTSVPKEWLCQQLLGNVRDSFFRKFGFFAHVAISAPTLIEFQEWSGFIESRIVDALLRLEASQIHCFPLTTLMKTANNGGLVQQRHCGSLFIGLGLSKSQSDLARNANAILSNEWTAALQSNFASGSKYGNASLSRCLISVRVIDGVTLASFGDLLPYEDARVTEEEEIELVELEISLSKNSVSETEQDHHQNDEHDDQVESGSGADDDHIAASSSPSSSSTSKDAKPKKDKKKKDLNVKNAKNSKNTPEEEGQLSKHMKMRTCVEAYNRIKWDKTCSTADFIIGYEDRFDGVQEVAFDEFDTGNIPYHRIRYFKKLGEGIVYDREKRIDKLFQHHKEKNVN